ncbi:MAG: HU family DNA-binding protein [Dehalococcoidia bacterium]|nr:HU family DNA-binding protein [Dehalococcoidia bacterium]
MIKAELIALVGAQAGTSNADTKRVLDGFRDVIQAKVRNGEDVAYPGLGKFSRAQRKARIGRNPQTGAEIKVKASKAPKFSAAAGLKAIVNGTAPAPKLAKAK